MSDDLPYVTHSGKLKLGDEVIEVHRLSNGQTIITEDGLAAFFRFLESGAVIAQSVGDLRSEIAMTPMLPVDDDK